MDQAGPLPDELGVLRSLQFNQLLSPHFQHSGPKFLRVVSVQCPFYVVLLVIMHKKQCNVKRALASNAIDVIILLAKSRYCMSKS